MVLLALIALALADPNAAAYASFEAPQAAFSLAPVARPEFVDHPIALDLHPVRAEPVRRWVYLLDEHLAGDRASVVFRNEVAMAQAHWAIAVRGGEAPAFTPDQEEELLESLQAAGILAVDDLFRETLGRSQVLATVDQVARALTSPTVTLRQPTNGGRMRLSLVERADVSERNESQARAALERPVRLDRPPPRQLRTGSGLVLRELDDDEETPLLDVSAWVSARNVVFDAWRVSALALNRQWSVGVRQAVRPGLDATLSSVSLPDTAQPSTLTAGLVLYLPKSVAPSWQVRTWAGVVLPNPNEPALERRGGVELRANWRWKAPQAPGGPGLGDRADREGPFTPGSRNYETQPLGWLSDNQPSGDR
jgi:hypothetical protein